MEASTRIPALLAYVPVIGWIYVLFFQQNNDLARFHMRQSIGLVLFLAAVLGGWAVLTWLLSWAPFGFLVGTILFTLVIAAIAFAVVALIMGMIYALRGRMVLLPIFGQMANRIGL
jgi:uncharacterized membrane protein